MLTISIQAPLVPILRYLMPHPHLDLVRKCQITSQIPLLTPCQSSPMNNCQHPRQKQVLSTPILLTQRTIPIISLTTHLIPQLHILGHTHLLMCFHIIIHHHQYHLHTITDTIPLNLLQRSHKLSILQ